jgi:hypothetical protein
MRARLSSPVANEATCKAVSQVLDPKGLFSEQKAGNGPERENWRGFPAGAPKLATDLSTASVNDLEK